jgi:hypothetical protein
MVVYIYIQTNKDWDYENKYKFGFTVNPKLRLNTDQHSHKTTYYSLYECCITDNYFIGYKEIDNIIANIGRNHEIINGLEKKFKITLDFLKEIDKYLVNNDGGNEFIYKDGLELLDKLLLIEYPKLGIDVKKLDVIDLNIFNSYIVEQTQIEQPPSRTPKIQLIQQTEKTEQPLRISRNILRIKSTIQLNPDNSTRESEVIQENKPPSTNRSTGLHGRLVRQLPPPLPSRS